MDVISPGMPEGTEEEFMKSLPSGVCPECGGPVYRKSNRGKRKIFCSDACRFAWKNKHPNPQNWKQRIAVCPTCGKEFIATREYAQKRKYCSRACANTGRAREKRQREE